ncbi:MAG: glycosyltransferase family 2 protein [Gammaproteobacteria bacterium]|nr:glycosyltransferase family 2 protein [Gammaproteobacteria bacterium]MCF6259908.1 glycosyltransferase family 2 protein [Gammaproteobacteria bacterium]
MFNPCIIIPTYNHHRYIHTVIDGLGQDIPCLIIDDGSISPCREILQDLARERPWVELVRLQQNQGKGIAVTTGLKHAYQQGFSHALQIDADGQHDTNDLPRFLSLAKKHPLAIIAGVRRYEEMPPKRRYGRMITDFWVWINTLSFTIKDSMCGYRLYPLAETMPLISDTAVGQRMDFDTDILVRLYWRGIAVEQLETRIHYHHDGVSHFDMLRDNLRISKMHTRLFFGMLVRLPVLMARTWKHQDKHAQHKN